MSRKRDMYIDKKHSDYGKLNRRKRGGRRGRGTGWAAVVVIFIVCILGLGTYYITGEKLREQSETRKRQQDLKSLAELKAGTGEGTGNGTGADVAAADTPESGTMEAGPTPSGTNSTPDNNREKGTQDTDTGQDNTRQGNTGAENTGPENTQDDNTPENAGTQTTDNAETMKETFMPGYAGRRTPQKVKGIYVTGPRAGNDSYMKDLIALVDTTELNTMVIDIKNDSGEITYKMDLPEVKAIHADVNYIGDIEQLISELKKKDIYLIARVVAFKDPILAEGRPDLCLKKKDKSIFRDKDGLSWVNPYKKEVWEYLVSVAGEAAKLGFDEVQFDYIRFSTDSGMKDVDFGKEADGKSKMDAITEFTKYACENLKPMGVYVSADVYGTIIDSRVDAKIVGQDYKEMAKYLDYICPMIYPSHYQDGAYGIKHPDLKPYDLILGALGKSQTALKEVEGNKAIVRSWLQDFTATWLDNHKSYGPKEIRAQIQAVYDAGYEEWILWNGNNNYTEEGLEKE